jgi:formylglycine-generating enzyme required for sulfatase activity
METCITNKKGRGRAACITAFFTALLLFAGCEDLFHPEEAGKDKNTVTPIAVTWVSLNKSALSLYTEDTETLIATVAPANATNKTVSWSSSAPSIATVSNAGLVTAVTAGTATITVRTNDGGYTANCTVTVTQTPVPGTLSSRTLNGVSVAFRYVPAGSFLRDSNFSNISVITHDYWMGETEVTQELFLAVMGTNPSYFDGSSGGDPAKDTPAGETQSKRPVERVSWYDAIAFCNKLSLADGKEPVYRVSGVAIDWAGLSYSSIPTEGNAVWDAVVMDTGKNGYRLPTEMEWMWAATGADKTVQPNMAGYNKAFAGSNGSNSIGNYAWDNSGEKTHEAGKKQGNELGLRDMSGNVWEWCWDWYGSYPSGTLTDRAGPGSGTYRVVRGGSWISGASSCAVSYRSGSGPGNRSYDVGFRVACP